MYTILNSFLLDGVDESFNTDDVLTPLATTTTGTWLGSFYIIDATPTGTEYLLSFGDTDANTDLSVMILTGGQVRAEGKDSSAKWRVTTSAAAYSDNSWGTLAITADGVNMPKIYIDGIEVAHGNNVTTDTSLWFSDLSSQLDNGRIGSVSINSAGDANNFNGNVGQVAFLDTELSAAQVLSWHNGGSPLNPQIEFGSSCKFFFNPENSGSTAEFTVNDPINNIDAVSVNLEDADKTTTTPYPS